MYKNSPKVSNYLYLHRREQLTKKETFLGIWNMRVLRTDQQQNEFTNYTVSTRDAEPRHFWSAPAPAPGQHSGSGLRLRLRVKLFGGSGSGSGSGQNVPAPAAPAPAPAPMIESSHEPKPAIRFSKMPKSKYGFLLTCP